MCHPSTYGSSRWLLCVVVQTIHVLASSSFEMPCKPRGFPLCNIMLYHVRIMALVKAG